MKRTLRYKYRDSEMRHQIYQTIRNGNLTARNDRTDNNCTCANLYAHKGAERTHERAPNRITESHVHRVTENETSGLTQVPPGNAYINGRICRAMCRAYI